MIEKSRKRKGEATNLYAELERNLNTAETRHALELERNDKKERDLIRLKEELYVSYKGPAQPNFTLKLLVKATIKKRD